jgi:hypothetical protein
MGYDAYAVAVIGIRHAPGVIKSKLFQEVTQRACGHEMAEGMKHCPECGAPRTTTFPMPIPEYDADDDPKLCGYELVHRGEGYYDDPEFIAFWSSDCVQARETVSESVQDFAFHDIEVKMRAKLAPLGLWEEGNFGLHVFMYESC